MKEVVCNTRGLGRKNKESVADAVGEALLNMTMLKK